MAQKCVEAGTHIRVGEVNPLMDGKIIYCLDFQANLIWQSEDLASRYPELKNSLSYE